MSSGSRRALLWRAATLSALPLTGAAAQGAAGWPTRPIHRIVSFAAGDNTDFIVRLFAKRLAAELGQPAMVALALATIAPSLHPL